MKYKVIGSGGQEFIEATLSPNETAMLYLSVVMVHI